MNWIWAKIILSFFGLVFFVVLVFFSFSWWSKDKTILPDFWETQIWEYMYKDTGNWEQTKSKIIFSEQVEWGKEGIFEKNVDIFSSVYSTQPNYSISKKANKIELNIWTGAYLLDFKNPFQKVYINVWKYNLELENGGMVYIENTWKEWFVVSLNNKTKVSFEKGVEMYLYPHMYFWFKVSRLSEKSEVDSLRLSQLASSLGYFPEEFWNILEGSLGKLVKKWNFLLKSLSIISERQKKYTKFLKNNIPNKVNATSSIRYVEKYFALFYNDKKKLVYYQNKILKQSIELLKNTQLDNEQINEITEGLQKIKKLDKIKYQEILNLINKFSYLAFNNLNNSRLVQNYSTLVQKIYWFKNSLEENLMKDFDRVNFNWEKTFYKKLLNSYKLEWSKTEQDYYFYFVRNVILEWFSDAQLSESNFNILIDIFDKYSSNLNSWDLPKTWDNSIIITNIKYNAEILQLISDALRTRYFGERTSQGLLKRTSIKITNLKWFENAVNNLEKYYSSWRASLDVNINKYAKIVKNYKNFKLKFEEYFFALKNYALYQKKYSNTGVAIGEVDVYTEANNSWLSEKNFIEYMKNFNGIDLNSIDVTIVEEGYMVDDISIEGKRFTFFMNPFRNNRIMDVLAKEIDFEKNSREDIFYKQLWNITYEMDEEKEKYKKLLEKAKDEDRERLNFKNFFKNNFFPSDSLRRLTCKDDANCKWRDIDAENEDEVIQLFKTATLLGPKWEFKSIRNFLQVKYVNLFVTKEKDSNFNITIQDSTLSIRVMKDKKIESALSEFDSDYALEWAHYFYNLVLKPYEKSFGWEKNYVFWNIPLNIKWNIWIAKFEPSMRDILEKIDYIEKKYRVYKLGNHWEISQINYFPKSGVVKFE